MVWLLGKTELPHNSTILLLAMYPEQMKAESQRCICIPMFIEELFTIAINGLKNEHNVVYTYNGILFSLKWEGNSDTCYNMDEL